MEEFRILEITQSGELDLELIICTGFRNESKEKSQLSYIFSSFRISNNRKGAEKHLNRIKNYIPYSGTVRILRLTEKQFCNMGLYQFEPDPQEEIVGINDFIAL